MTSPLPPSSSPFPFPTFSPIPSAQQAASQPTQTVQPGPSTQTAPTFNQNHLFSTIPNPNPNANTGPSPSSLPLPFSIPSNPPSSLPYQPGQSGPGFQIGASPMALSLPFGLGSNPSGGGGAGAGGTGLTPLPLPFSSGLTPNFSQSQSQGMGSIPPFGITPQPSSVPGLPLNLGLASGAGINGAGMGMGMGMGMAGMGMTGTGIESDEIGMMKQGLDNASAVVERLIFLLSEIGRMEAGLFDLPAGQGGDGAEGHGVGEDTTMSMGSGGAGSAGAVGRSEGMQVGLGGLSRIELLHLEYVQLLNTLQTIANTTLISSLPSPLSLALPSTDTPAEKNSTVSIAPAASTGNTAPGTASSIPNPGDPTPAANAGSASQEVLDGLGRLPTVEEITAFAERQANLEFDRREAVRVSARTVLDVLGKR